MDAFLANWDAVCSNNALKSADGAVRIDVGGTFDYRAQGAKKPFGSVVDEITTLADPTINPTSAKIFSTMTKDDLIESLRKVVDIDDNDLIKLVESEGMEQYKDVLLQRKQYLADFLKTVENTPQDGLDISSYLKKVKNETYKTTIDDALDLKQINEIQESINNSVKDIETKKALQEQLNAKKAALKGVSSQTVSKPLSAEAIDAALKQSGFVYDIDGNYYVNFPEGFEDAVKNSYGEYTSAKIIGDLKKPLTKTEVQKLTKFINICDGKYSDLFSQNMLETVSYFRTLEASHSGFYYHLDKLTPAQMDAVVNTFKVRANSDELSALINYKGIDYTEINGALTEMKNNSKYIPDSTVQSKIDSITAYIDKQPISQSMTVYRGEGYEVLDSVDIGGKKLSDLMKEAAKSGDENKIDELIYKVQNNNYVATQERFMSTSLLSDASFKYKDIIWELELPEGTKGTFIEGVNVKGQNNTECEYLLQRNSKITITSMEYKGGKWHLGGIINN